MHKIRRDLLVTIGVLILSLLPSLTNASDYNFRVPLNFSHLMDGVQAITLECEIFTVPMNNVSSSTEAAGFGSTANKVGSTAKSISISNGSINRVETIGVDLQVSSASGITHADVKSWKCYSRVQKPNANHVYKSLSVNATDSYHKAKQGYELTVLRKGDF